MRKSPIAGVERKLAERELLKARQALTHLVEMYNSGRWRRYYKERTFVTMVRQARQAVDRWTDICQ